MYFDPPRTWVGLCPTRVHGGSASAPFCFVFCRATFCETACSAPVRTTACRCLRESVRQLLDLLSLDDGVWHGSGCGTLRADCQRTGGYDFGTLYLCGKLSQDRDELLDGIAATLVRPGGPTAFWRLICCAPCCAGIGAIKGRFNSRDGRSRRWVLCVFAYAVSLIVYQLGGLITAKQLWTEHSRSAVLGGGNCLILRDSPQLLWGKKGHLGSRRKVNGRILSPKQKKRIADYALRL